MDQKEIHIAVVDDNTQMRGVLSHALAVDGYSVESFPDGRSFLESFSPNKYHLVLLDLMMPDITGIEVVHLARQIDPFAVIVIVTGYSSNENIVEAIRAGAFDVLSKPFNLDELRLMLHKALRQSKINIELAAARVENFEDSFHGLLGRSSEMRRIFQKVRQIAARDVTVLIQGASGTGKELLARAIHKISHRALKPFVAVNCGAIPETLIDAELFGFKKGAFTGAVANRDGLIRSAAGGTLFLDEIGDLPQPTQLRLLRFLQEKEVRPVGSDETFTVDVRVISATNRDLADLVEKNVFRDDLYYRLSVVPITLPTLVARREDIPLLTAHFIEKVSRRHSIQPPRIEPDAMESLVRYHWPGNVRQLENVVERLAVFATDCSIRLSDLPEEIREYGKTLATMEVPLGLTLDELERWYISRILLRVNGNRTQAAELLGIDRRTLQRKLAEWGKP